MNFTKMFYAAKMKAKEHAPEILMGVGTVSFVGTIILACKATTKIKKIMEDHAEKLADINDKLYLSATNEGDEYEFTEHDAKKEKTNVYLTTGLSIVRIYAPSLLLGSISITSYFAAYSIVRKRYVAMSMVAAGLSDTLLKYRGRVIEELGSEMDDHFLNGTNRDKVSITTMNEDGKTKTEKVTIQTLKDKNGLPIYAKIFDEANPHWTKNPNTNLMFLRGQQCAANDIFKIREVLLLNDVYSLLGFPITEIGSKVGWIKSRGDDKIDFGLDGNDERTLAFVRGFDPSFLLNFNCVPILPGDIAYA